MDIARTRPPSLDKLLESPALRELIEVHGRANMLAAAREALDAWRVDASQPFDEAQFELRCRTQLADRAFQEYKKVFESFPESGRVGEAVAKMAEHYYKQKDYSRAVDVFETVLNDHPDARFLDVILFNYGRCLYRMERRGDARKQFDQLISDYPESPLAADAKRISEALSKAGG